MTTLAVPRLYDLVVARFAAEAASAVPPTEPPAQSFGWKEPPKQVPGPRIVWVPGDDSSGDAGTLDAPRQVNRNPRPLATLHELVTVYITSADTASLQDERAQYTIVRDLYDAWLRAVHRAARGTYQVRSTKWVTGKTVRPYGAALRVLLSVEAMVPDTPYTVATPPIAAEIEVTELDHTETTTAP